MDQQERMQNAAEAPVAANAVAPQGLEAEDGPGLGQGAADAGFANELR